MCNAAIYPKAKINLLSNLETEKAPNGNKDKLFTMRTVKHWNRLPREVCSVSLLEIFNLDWLKP